MRSPRLKDRIIFWVCIFIAVDIAVGFLLLVSLVILMTLARCGIV